MKEMLSIFLILKFQIRYFYSVYVQISHLSMSVFCSFDTQFDCNGKQVPFLEKSLTSRVKHQQWWLQSNAMRKQHKLASGWKSKDSEVNVCSASPFKVSHSMQFMFDFLIYHCFLFLSLLFLTESQVCLGKHLPHQEVYNSSHDNVPMLSENS